MDKKNKPNVLGAFIVLLVVCAIFVPLIFYMYPKSAIGNPLCKEMGSQGYYETEWDTVGYESCKINHNSKWNPYETNQTCMEERFKIDDKNLSNYGVHCVWGSPGYFIFIFIGACLAIITMTFTMFIVEIYHLLKGKYG